MHDDIEPATHPTPPTTPVTGGWLSGSSGGLITPADPIGDDFDGDLLVGTAVASLKAFGADLTRAEARKLLPFWRHFGDLNSREHVAVLKRFPSAHRF